jgi:thioesterase domain-containing protein
LAKGHLGLGDLNSRVQSVLPSVDQNVYVVSYVSGSIEKSLYASGVVCVTGPYHGPCVLKLPGEDNFQGRISYGIGNDLSLGDFEGKRVVVLGHGSFAVETSRVALLNGAKSVAMICRKRNLVLSAFAAFILSAFPGALPTSAVFEIMKPLYDYIGVDLGSLFETTSKGMSIKQTTLLAASDFYFLAQAAGKLVVIVDNIDCLLENSLQTVSGNIFDADIVVKCYGLRDESDAIAKNIFGDKIKYSHGVWINGDSNLMALRGIGDEGTKVLPAFSTSATFMTAVYAEAYLACRKSKDLKENIMKTQQIDKKYDSHFLAEYAVQLKSVAAKKLKNQRVFKKFLGMIEEEWNYYCRSLSNSMQASILSLVKLPSNIQAKSGLVVVNDQVQVGQLFSDSLEVQSGEDLENELLYCLRAGDPTSNCTPLVIIYAGYGISYGYQLLELLDKSQPVYATQAPEYTSPFAFNSIEARARHHKLVLAQKFGLVRLSLVGYSFGGLLAVEIARFFEEEGVTCNLTLLDPVPRTGSLHEKYSSYLELKAKTADLVTGNKFNFCRSATGNSVENELLLNSKIFDAVNNRKLARHIQLISHVAALLSSAALSYQEEHPVKKLKHATIFVLSKGREFYADNFSMDYNDNVYGWSSNFESVKHVGVDGKHVDFFKHRQNVLLLAEHLKSSCERADVALS